MEVKNVDLDDTSMVFIKFFVLKSFFSDQNVLILQKLKFRHLLVFPQLMVLGTWFDKDDLVLFRMINLEEEVWYYLGRVAQLISSFVFAVRPGKYYGLVIDIFMS